MPERRVWYVGDRNPSISDTIEDSAGAVLIQGLTLTFKMRPVNSSVPKVNAAAVNLDDGTAANKGKWRYDWAALDVDTAGEYLAWVEAVSGGKVQAVHEAIIEFQAHGPASQLYVELKQVKATLELSTNTFGDGDLRAALTAACRGIDSVCGRRFYLDTGAANVRYYSPFDKLLLPVDDIVAVTSLKTDPGGDGTFEQTWTVNTDYTREPLNAAADARPWSLLRAHPSGSYRFPTAYPRSVEVTGQFGWQTVPGPIVEAATILAGKLFKRAREAPFGIVTLGVDVGAAMRIARMDPDVAFLIGPYTKIGVY